MFIINGDLQKNSYVCGPLKAKYLMKHLGIVPFYYNKYFYFFAIDKEEISLPWYIKILK